MVPYAEWRSVHISNSSAFIFFYQIATSNQRNIVYNSIQDEAVDDDSVLNAQVLTKIWPTRNGVLQLLDTLKKKKIDSKNINLLQ